MENIISFFEEVEKNNELQAELKALAEKKAGIAEIVILANKKGFVFTEAELEQYGKYIQASEKLSEDQLTNVAGGSLRPPRPIAWLYISIEGFQCDPDND